MKQSAKILIIDDEKAIGEILAASLKDDGFLVDDQGSDSGTGVVTQGGNLSITGTAGGSGSTGSNNVGAVVQNGAMVASTGTGDVTITGTGGAGNQYNQGLRITGSAILSSAKGSLTASGTGGGSGTGSDNPGVLINASSVGTGGTGAVSVTGQGGTPLTSSPASSTVPLVGSSKPAIIRSVVVLPEPEGPSIVKNSPRPISRSIPATADTPP